MTVRFSDPHTHFIYTAVKVKQYVCCARATRCAPRDKLSNVSIAPCVEVGTVTPFKKINAVKSEPI
jgi:hypothetical protein